jgi:site-specific recombinase XerD
MPNGPITKRAVDAADPGDKDYFIWDAGGRDVVKGFGLKVTPSGGKIYVFQYRIERPGSAKRPAPKRYTIGAHGKLTPEQARAQAKMLAALAEQGIDPRQRDLDKASAADEAVQLAAEKVRIEGELAFEVVAAKWLAEYELDHRPTSVGQAKVSINKYLLPKLRGKPLPHITKADLQAVIDGIPAARKASRQQVFAYASILFRWALERGDIRDNFVPSMAKPKGPKARDRVLSDEELATVWQATGQMRAPLGAFYRLLLLTGQRREEVAAVTWAEVSVVRTFGTVGGVN